MLRRRSSGSLIRNALYSKSHGISSQELGHLCALSYDTHGLEQLEAQLHARLSKVSGKSAETRHGNGRGLGTSNLKRCNTISTCTPPNPSTSMISNSSISRVSNSSTNTFAENARLSVELKRRSWTVDSSRGSRMPSFLDTLSRQFRTDVDLAVLKCLTVIVHLCQTGSSEFVSWLVASYRALISPIRNLVFNESLSRAIQQKVSLVIEYCEDSKVLAQARTFSKSLKMQLPPGIVGP